MRTNDIKKGTRVRLRNGWFGTMADNRKGNTRNVTVDGDLGTSTGSVYAWDIMLASVNGEFTLVEHTPKQLKDKARAEAIFGE